MSLVLDPTNTDIETSNENIIGIGTHVFEVNMPAGVAWTSGLTVDIDIQSPYPGDEDQWETLHTFNDKGTWDVNMIRDRKYRAVASVSGPWCFLNTVIGRVTK